MSKTKICRVCGVEKDLSEYYKRGGKKSPDTYRTVCKPCDIKRVQSQYDPKRSRDNFLQRTYNITLETYNEMLAEQEHSCAICGTTEAGGPHGQMMVDHCHDTGKVRGLLCKSCNIAIGEMKDNPDIAHKAWMYLCIDKDRVEIV